MQRKTVCKLSREKFTFSENEFVSQPEHWKQAVCHIRSGLNVVHFAQETRSDHPRMNPRIGIRSSSGGLRSVGPGHPPPPKSNFLMKHFIWWTGVWRQTHYSPRCGEDMIQTPTFHACSTGITSNWSQRSEFTGSIFNWFLLLYLSVWCTLYWGKLPRDMKI